METPESIRTSLQKGEWVPSINFKDTYFHMKYLCFHVQDQSYEFKAVPFGLSTVLMEFTTIVMETKLMTQNKGIRIHQYLDDWLVRDTSTKLVSIILRPW